MPELPCPWSGFEPAPQLFCENRLCAWITEPANTWSNGGYILIGLLILWLERKERRPQLTFFGYAAILVGLGSTFLHATSTSIGGIVDLGTMFLLSGYLIVLNLYRLTALATRHLVMVFFLLLSSALLLTVRLHIGTYVFAFQVAVFIGLEIILLLMGRPAPRLLPLLLAGVFISVAFASWILDVTRVYCHPDNHLFNGHVVWHLVNCFCYYFLYRYFEPFFPRVIHTPVSGGKATP